MNHVFKQNIVEIYVCLYNGNEETYILTFYEEG